MRARLQWRGAGGGVIALVCLHCDHSNLADANFCSACGAGLLRRLCPSCHVANGVGAQFCHACGFRLQQQAGDEPTAAASGPQLSLVRSRPPGPASADTEADAVAQAGADVEPATGGDAMPASPPARPLRWWASSSARGVAGFVVVAALFAWLVDGTTAPYARPKTAAAQDPVGALPSPAAAPVATALPADPSTAARPPAADAGSITATAAPAAVPTPPPAPTAGSTLTSPSMPATETAMAPEAAPAVAPAEVAPVLPAPAGSRLAAVSPEVADAGAPPVATPPAVRASSRATARPVRRNQAGTRAAASTVPTAPVPQRRTPAIACTANAQALGLCSLNP
jgi:Double zinc ribbon